MPECVHDWKEEYYGIRCSKCDVFYPHGSEPWLPIDDDYDLQDEDSDWPYGYDFEPESDEWEDALSECSMLADGTCLQAGSEHCDFDCPFRDMEIEEVE